MIDKSIVNKYAKALSILMSSEKKPESKFKDFFTLVNVICGEKRSVNFFQNPAIPVTVKVEKLSEVLNNLKLDRKYVDFLLKVIKFTKIQ